MSAYLASRPRWSRATIAFHVQSLRTLFRHGATRGWCRSGFAETIEAPRLYTHERLPQGPQWSEVQRLLDANRGDTATQIRNYAMLVLLAVYGFRSGEVRGLTLDDIDWEHERIHPPRPKQRKVGEYPLVGEVGEAILRYITRVRPRCASRALFRHAETALSTAVRRGPCDDGPGSSAATGPEAPSVRSARVATRERDVLLGEGFTLKQIGDHLGHTMVRATEMYAKVDIALTPGGRRHGHGGAGRARAPMCVELDTVLRSGRSRVPSAKWLESRWEVCDDALTACIEEYVRHRRSLGVCFHGEQVRLSAFVKSVGDIALADVTPEAVRRYIDGKGPVTQSWFCRFHTVAGFYRFAMARQYHDHARRCRPARRSLRRSSSPTSTPSTDMRALLDAVDARYEEDWLVRPTDGTHAVAAALRHRTPYQRGAGIEEGATWTSRKRS